MAKHVNNVIVDFFIQMRINSVNRQIHCVRYQIVKMENVYHVGVDIN